MTAVRVAEVLAVALGFAYAALAVRRNRLCWVAGGASSGVLAALFAASALPMQAVLQLYYVAMSVYGFWHWSRAGGVPQRVVTTWPLRSHLLAWAAILALSGLTARFLAAETQAQWPYLDSAVAWASVLATWFVARVKLENWLYWIVTDAVLIFLSIAQGLTIVALLYVGYLGIAVVGFFTWLKALRSQAVPA